MTKLKSGCILMPIKNTRKVRESTKLLHIETPLDRFYTSKQNMNDRAHSVLISRTIFCCFNSWNKELLSKKGTIGNSCKYANFVKHTAA